MESRRGAFIDINNTNLIDRMKKYYDKQLDWQSLESLGTGLTRNAAGYHAAKARENALKKETFDPPTALHSPCNCWCFCTAAIHCKLLSQYSN